jgi:protein tyrosine phosphatase (PTP) superfamily phosphohydrolase (DUF442 family)
MNDTAPITNWLRYDDRLTTSGQPTETQLEGLAALGVTHVINLALHTHELALEDERASVEALGMHYTHIPVAFDNPTEHDFNAFCAALQAAGESNTHIHCIMNWRVTAFLFRFQRDMLGMDASAARAQMERIWTPTRGDDPSFASWVKFIAPH